MVRRELMARDRGKEKLDQEVLCLRAKLHATFEVFDKELAAARSEMREFALRREMADGAAASAKVTAELRKRIGEMESTVERQRTRLEVLFRDMQERVDSASSQVGESKERMMKETFALGSEMSGIRSAATSLVQGVLRALQVIGLFHSEMDFLPRSFEVAGLVTRRCGVEVCDLLEWEKSGQSLASRVSQHWESFQALGAPSMLAVMERKAEQKDVHAVGSTLRLVGSQSPPGTLQKPGGSTSLGFNDDPNGQSAKPGSAPNQRFGVGPQAPEAPRVDRPPGSAPPRGNFRNR
jgi:hypothetical protein